MKTECWALPEFLIHPQNGGVGAQEHTFQMNSEVMLMRLIWEPHFENICSTFSAQRGYLHLKVHICVDSITFKRPPGRMQDLSHNSECPPVTWGVLRKRPIPGPPPKILMQFVWGRGLGIFFFNSPAKWNE